MKAYKITITINKFNDSKWLDIKKYVENRHGFSEEDFYYYKSENRILLDIDPKHNTLRRWGLDILADAVTAWSNTFYEDLVEINGSRDVAMVSVFSGLNEDTVIMPGHELSYQYGGESNPIINAEATPINDHTCPTCKNNRCSRNERTCWRCGNKL